jgi:hypothetical protein
VEAVAVAVATVLPGQARGGGEVQGQFVAVGATGERGCTISMNHMHIEWVRRVVCGDSMHAHTKC